MSRSAPKKHNQRSIKNGGLQYTLPDTINWTSFHTHLKHLPKKSITQVREAFDLGKEMHDGQERKSGDPYFLHPLSVAQMMADEGAGAETIIAVLLHDTVEDTSLTLDDIEERFGQKVSLIVDGVTKLGEEELGEESSAREKRIETLRKMFTYMQEDIRIVVIKLYDRLHNMMTLSFFSEEKQKRIAEDTMEVFVKVAGQLSLKQLRDELEYLSLQYLEPEWVSAITREQQRMVKGTKAVIQHMRGLLKAETEFEPDFYAVPVRWTKLLNHVQQGSERAPFPFSVAITVPEDPDCYRVLYHLHRLWQHDAQSFEDFVNDPQINGYRALHTTIILQDGRRVQCKIRTQEMDEYSRKGIMMSCFTKSGTDHPIAWLASTITVSRGLQRTEEFWESLQSDILGESMLIHGPGDRALMVPTGSTALDGVFYCFGDGALRTKEVRIHGQAVALGAPLRYGDALSIDLGKRNTVERSWLGWVQTGVAIAKIRTALKDQSRKKKIEVGRQMLQDVMTENRGGLLEEFQEKSMEKGLRSLGFSGLDEACIAIAEGVFEAQEVYAAVFQRPWKKQPITSDERRFLLRFSILKDDIETLRRLITVYQKFNISLGNIRIWPILRERNQRRFTVTTQMSKEESEYLKRDVISAGGLSVDISQQFVSLRHTIGAFVLAVLWGLDPVFAKLIVQSGVSPFDLTALRFGIIFLCSGVFLAFKEVVKWKSTSTKLRRIRPFNKALLFSGLALFCTAIFTYISLQYLSASTYITVIVAGTIITFTPIQVATVNTRSAFFTFLTVGFLVISLVLLLSEDQPLLSIGPLSGVAASLGFSLYSIASTRFQLKEFIRTRYLSFVFYLSLFAFVCSLPFVFYSGFLLLQSHLLLASVVFVVCFTMIPYILYFELLKRGGAEATGRLLPLVVLVAVLGQYFVFSQWNWVLLLPVLVSLWWVLLYKGKVTSSS